MPASMYTGPRNISAHADGRSSVPCPKTMSACRLAGCQNLSRIRWEGGRAEALDWGVALDLPESWSSACVGLGIWAHHIRPADGPGINRLAVTPSLVPLQNTGEHGLLRMEWKKDSIPPEGIPEQLWVEMPPEELLFLSDESHWHPMKRRCFPRSDTAWQRCILRNLSTGTHGDSYKSSSNGHQAHVRRVLRVDDTIPVHSAYINKNSNLSDRFAMSNRLEFFTQQHTPVQINTEDQEQQTNTVSFSQFACSNLPLRWERHSKI